MAVRHVVAAAATGLVCVAAGAAAVHADGAHSAGASTSAASSPAPSPAAVSSPAPSSTAPSPSVGASTVPAAAPTTPALPSGIRSVVALGDSVPAGSGSDAVPFPELLRRALAPANPGVTLTNLGSDGATAADLADDLAHDAATRTAVAGADLVLVTAGANDLYPAFGARTGAGCDAACGTKAVTAAASSLQAALATIERLDTRPGHRVLVTTYWNAFQDGDVARAALDAHTVAWTDALTKQANTAFCTAARTTGATCVDLYPVFKADGAKDPTPLLADDGDHPNQAGHTAIATALLTALERP